ncbi:MAG: FAD synthase [Candidatus Moranbacteria bacterium GW2011_GWF2_35_54]|nr:MAG: FAD synthase [Candidatus Moranbacteria bacterium GW2011_GWF2_35_54]
MIKKYKPAIICLGYDQKFFIDNLKSELNKIGLEKTEIIRLKAYYPQIYKSSKLKNKIIE